MVGIVRRLGRPSTRRVAATAMVALLLGGCWWRQPGYGPENTRYNPHERALTTANVGRLGQLWSVGVDAIELSGPVVSDGSAYVSYRGETTMGARAIDADSGATVWDRTLASGADPWFVSPVTFSGDALWLQYLDMSGTTCGTRAGVDPASGDVTSSEAVNHPVSDIVTSDSVAVYTEVVVCGQEAPVQLVARDPATRETQWTSSLPAPAGRPLIADGVIYVGSGGRIYAFDADGCGAATCEPLWVRDGEAPTAAADGRLYAIHHGTFTPGRGQPTVQTGEVRAYDAATGALLWYRHYRGSAPGAPGNAGVIGLAVTDEAVYVTAWEQDGATSDVAVDAYPVAGCGSTSSCPPTWSGPTPAATPPIVGGGVVYVGTWADGGRVTAFDTDGCGASTCSPLASVAVPGTPGGMALADGKVFVTSSSGGSGRLTALAPLR